MEMELAHKKESKLHKDYIKILNANVSLYLMSNLQEISTKRHNDIVEKGQWEETMISLNLILICVNMIPPIINDALDWYFQLK